MDCTLRLEFQVLLAVRARPILAWLTVVLELEYFLVYLYIDL